MLVHVHRGRQAPCRAHLGVDSATGPAGPGLRALTPPGAWEAAGRTGCLSSGLPFTQRARVSTFGIISNWVYTERQQDWKETVPISFKAAPCFGVPSFCMC